MHWYRDDTGALVGEPPYRATDEQMRAIPACHTCATGASYTDGLPAARTIEGVLCNACFTTKSLAGTYASVISPAR